MMGDNYDECLAIVLREEGGAKLSLIKADPGNWDSGKVGVGSLKGTKYGIAASSHPNLDIANLTLDAASRIYRAEYWTAAGCHVLPIGVDLATFDPAVNSGVSRAVKWRNATVTITDPVKRVQAISAARRSFYQSLKTFGTFGKGWLARVARIEAAAVRMALAGVGLKPANVQAELASHATTAAKKSSAATKQAGATVATGGGAAATAPTGHISLWIVCAGVAVAAAVLVILINRARAQRVLADAYAAEAGKVTG